MPTAVLVPSSVKCIDLYMHIFINLFIDKNIEMDKINCNYGRISFLRDISRITLEKAADCRNGEGEEHIMRWIKG